MSYHNLPDSMHPYRAFIAWAVSLPFSSRYRANSGYSCIRISVSSLLINTSTCFFMYALRYAPPMSIVMTCLRSLAAIVAIMNSPTSDIVGDDVSFSVYKYLFCLCPPPTSRALILLNNPFGKYFGFTNVLEGIRALR